MDSSQKRDRDRKQRQRRQEKAVRRKERAEQKVLRRTTPELLYVPPDLNSPGPEVVNEVESEPAPKALDRSGGGS